MARSVVLLKPNVANSLLFIFCEQKFIQHDPITIAIDCNGFSLLIFEEKFPNYASGPKSAPNSDSYGFSVPQMRQVCLFTCPPRSKWASSEKMIFFPKSASSVNRSVAILPSVIQVYTQPYLFGGRIKLIICLFRHELRTSWRKNLRWLTLDDIAIIKKHTFTQCPIIFYLQYLE